MNVNNIEKRITAIEKRNDRVSLDKAWETSWTRRLTIAGLTYIVVLIYLFVIGNNNPWVNAIVPPTGFLLSTLAIGWVRNVWQKNQ
jgi:hypothetical protein